MHNCNYMLQLHGPRATASYHQEHCCCCLQDTGADEHAGSAANCLMLQVYTSDCGRFIHGKGSAANNGGGATVSMNGNH
jgi:hypothetical protein